MITVVLITLGLLLANALFVAAELKITDQADNICRLQLCVEPGIGQ